MTGFETAPKDEYRVTSRIRRRQIHVPVKVEVHGHHIARAGAGDEVGGDDVKAAISIVLADSDHVPGI